MVVFPVFTKLVNGTEEWIRMRIKILKELIVTFFHTYRERYLQECLNLHAINCHLIDNGEFSTKALSIDARD